MGIFQQDESEAGLAGSLRFRCGKCGRLLIDMPLSGSCPKLGKRASSVKEINYRAVVGCYNSGLGFNAFERLAGILNMPCMSASCFRTTQTYVDEAAEKVGDGSVATAAQEERQMSYDAGNEPDEQSRYPVPLSFDAQWLKPGRAHNAPDGYDQCSQRTFLAFVPHRAGVQAARSRLP